MKNINEIVKSVCDKIKSDIEKLEGIECIDFIDLFPISQKHKDSLDKEATKIANCIKETSRGNFYVLKNPIQTIFGEIKIFKVRVFDESKLNYEGAPDFKIYDYSTFKNKYLQDEHFSYIERLDGLEYKTDNCLAYFFEQPTSEYYGVK